MAKRDARVAQVVEPAGHAGSPPAPCGSGGSGSSRRQRVAGAVREHEGVRPGLDEPLEVVGEHRRDRRRDRDRAHAGGRLRRPPDPRPVLQLDELFGDAHLAPGEIDALAAQADELAPAHAGVDREVDQRPEALGVRLGQRAWPASQVEEGHLAASAPWAGAPGRTGWRGSSASRPRPAACGAACGSGGAPTTAPDRRPSSSLSHCSISSARQPAEAYDAEARQDVAVEVAPVRLLRRRRQRPGERQERLGPRRRAACRRRAGRSSRRGPCRPRPPGRSARRRPCGVNVRLRRPPERVAVADPVAAARACR